MTHMTIRNPNPTLESTAQTRSPAEHHRRSMFFVAIGIVFSVGAAAQSGAGYPTKPIRLIVPFEPGGSTDVTARIVAHEMGKRMNQAVVVENIGGVGGSRGTDVVAKAKPDGYTLLWANVAPIAINVHLYKKLPYDPVKDFAAITLAAVFPNVLVVQPALKAETPSAFLKKAKTEYKDLTYASAGNGSSTHLAGEWLKSLTGANWLHVPFKGGGPALMAVASGQVDMYFSAIPSAMPYLRAGQVRALATTGRTRDTSLPDVPTMAELGLRDYEVVNWNGLLAPANTPSAIVQTLNTAAVAALSSPHLKAQLDAQGAIASPMTTAAFSEFIATESIKWARVVKTSNARVE